MIDRREKLVHVLGSLSLGECLVLLLGDLVKELAATDVLHDQVYVLGVVVCLEVLHDVRVVQRVQDVHFLDDAVDVVGQLHLVEHLNCHVN